MTSTTILVPLDGSAQSNAALPLARTLARATDAAMTLLRVMSHAGATETRQAASGLQQIASELAGSGLSVDTVVRQGRPADEILEEIRARAAALVVMRTHGRAGIERAILGSVAEQVLEHSPVPVVLMRPGERRITAIRKLLVPVDGSPGGAVALESAEGFARTTGASIKLVQVCVPIAMQTAVTYDGGSMGYYDPDWDDESMASAREYVDGLVGQLREGGLEAEGVVFAAPAVAPAIVELAEKEAADLVVMSTRALTGPARTLLGSVANAVVRTAHCPVLLVHRTHSSATEASATSSSAGSVKCGAS
jgi:nucleotide-binding universal stress UspA family protein